jgi:hypothetical protein
MRLHLNIHHGARARMRSTGFAALHLVRCINDACVGLGTGRAGGLLCRVAFPLQRERLNWCETNAAIEEARVFAGGLQTPREQPATKGLPVSAVRAVRFVREQRKRQLTAET